MRIQLSGQQTQHLRELLEREVAAGKQLLSCLEAEKEAFSGRDPQVLEQAAQAKLVPVDHIEQLERERTDYLSQQGLPTAPAELKAFFTNPQTPAELRQIWERLIETAQACQAQIQFNRQLLQAHRNLTEDLLKLLHGHLPNNDLYDPKGQKKPGGTGNTLAKA